MFLSSRARQAEYFDAPDRSPREVAEGYRLLARVNRVFRFAEPFQKLIPQMVGDERCRSLSLLDLGAGDGSLGAELAAWASQKGWRWHVTNLDLNPLALRLAPQARNVAASAACLPFQEKSFDVVIASQMTHHLESEAEVVRHFQEAQRVARAGVLVYDLHRSLPMYLMIWLFLHASGFPAHFREDGLLSVRRGWRVEEWKALAAQAGLDSARVWYEHGARILLQSRKTP